MRDKAAAEVFELSTGVHASAVVRAAVQLGLADAVGDEPVTLEALASAVGARQDTLGRFMRLLTAYGIFAEVGEDRYEHTPTSRALRSDAPDGPAGIIRLGGDWNWILWGLLAHSVRTGESAFQAHYGQDIFAYFDQNRQAGDAFQHGLSVVARREDPLVAEALPVKEGECVVELAGGKGNLLRAVLERHPGVTGVLVETEQALDTVDPALREGPLAERFRAFPGDCQTAVPGGGDVYLIKQTLHMWDDETCLRVLANCRRAAPPGARVVVVEQLLTDGPAERRTRLMDLHMLLVAGGRERTEKDFAELFHRAGLSFGGIRGEAGDLRLIEAVTPEA
ncbi:methyltransferase [Nonomuraea cavernae]|nr:methyltransferase [Nonomuraea cavernae]MCA2189478.1 acetylserotonin O-methyltransferase [Nonomuraea cavernae]